MFRFIYKRVKDRDWGMWMVLIYYRYESPRPNNWEDRCSRQKKKWQRRQTPLTQLDQLRLRDLTRKSNSQPWDPPPTYTKHPPPSPMPLSSSPNPATLAPPDIQSQSGQTSLVSRRNLSSSDKAMDLLGQVFSRQHRRGLRSEHQWIRRGENWKKGAKERCQARKGTLEGD